MRNEEPSYISCQESVYNKKVKCEKQTKKNQNKDTQQRKTMFIRINWLIGE
jgi:hypothetical protein